MNNGIKRALAEKVKEEAKDCHKLYKTSSIICEPQYIDFYIHALDYYGCVITENSFNDYLYFIVDRPELLKGSIEECISSYVEQVKPSKPKRTTNLDWLLYVAYFLMGLLLGYVI